MIEVSNITKTFYHSTEKRPVLNNISLRVNAGEVYGFLGPNGAGKTTLIKIILALVFSDSGSIKINGIENSSVKARQFIGYMNESPQFYYHLTGKEVINYAAQLFNISLSDTQINSLLAKVGLGSAATLPVRKYSKGMHQRLGFAVALCNSPKVLILDEPLDGLDPIGRLDFKEMILAEKKKGTTVFFSSHILSDAEELCDRIGIIANGELLSEGDPKKLVSKNKTLEEYFVNVVKQR